MSLEQTQFVPGSNRGSKGGTQSLCVKSLCALPCVAKWLQTDLNYFRIIYGVTDTDFSCLGINDCVTDADTDTDFNVFELDM